MKKILRKKTPTPKSPLEDLKQREETLHNKMWNSKEYYLSEEGQIKGKQIYNEKKEYVKNNPKDFEIVGAQIHQIIWKAAEELPAGEREILKLTGEGKYYEDLGNYEKAIEIYQQADDLTMTVCANDIKELIAEHGPGDYLYTARIRQRVRVCEKAILKDKVKKLESEAKDLEKTNPEKAIEVYNELNVLKPGLKKYDKRIEVCKKRL